MYNQLRTTKKYLKQYGVNFKNEKREREERNTILEANHLCAENAVFEEKTVTTMSKTASVERPIVYVDNLCDFILHRLDTMDSHNQLIWRNSSIPNDEIWIKVGGDHGGDSFKISVQVLNTSSPNSKDNTIVVECFKAKDTYSNLKSGYERIQEDIHNLQHLTWQGKQIRLTVFGDYLFLPMMYGISGSAGTHLCLWCHVTKAEIQNEESSINSELRTLSSLDRDYSAYQCD